MTDDLNGLQRLADLPEALQICRLCKQIDKFEKETDQRPVCLNSMDNRLFISAAPAVRHSLSIRADKDWQANHY